MLFGLCNAPATFERLMEQVLLGLPQSMALVYLDDVLVPGRNFQEHLTNLRGSLSMPAGGPLQAVSRKM